jgi:hypothetical protein
MSVDRASGEPKKRRSSPAWAQNVRAAVDRAEAGRRAVKHAAAGGRMTARWSGVDLRSGRWGFGSRTRALRPKPRTARWQHPVFPEDRPRSTAQWACSPRLAGSLQR